MGSSLSCVGCIEREHEEQLLKLVEAEEAKQTPRDHVYSQISEEAQQSQSSSEAELESKLNAIVNARKQSKSVPSSPGGEQLQAQIDAIVKNRKQCKKVTGTQVPVPSSPASELKDQINAIVKARAEHRKQQESPVPCSPAFELQDQINTIVGYHAKSLKEQRLSWSDDAVPDATDLAYYAVMASPKEHASPSPAKDLSDMDLAYYANVALSNAKVRTCSETVHEHMEFSPAVDYAHWEAYEEDIAPCQLSFAEEASTVFVEAEPACVQPMEQATALTVEVPKAKVDARPFDINEIPSPTRNRARKLWASVTEKEAVDEVKPTAIAESTAVEEEFHSVADEAEQQVEEDRQVLEAKWLREMEENAKMVAMDQRVVESFLESVKISAWQERVRTPIKGSNLYTKHIRPCRPEGTSIKVQESSFRNLAGFLQFLEAEGLLRLRPGLTDPVVTEIRFDACCRYTFTMAPQQHKEAPHNAGCSCRKCIDTQALAWQ